MKPVSNITKGLRMLYDYFKRNFKSLEALHQDTNQDVIVSIMTSKIPKDVLLHLQIHKGAIVKWTVNRLMELLHDYFTAREQTDQQCQTEASGSNTSPARSLRSSTEALLSGQKASPRENNKRICRFCNGNHWSDECRRYETVEERKQRRKGSSCSFV